jgi:alkanesulfonate monooxygenase SsuD/methylene tetrahydromethanopterin reductase-like flavin-dependent oxidoreductase (luciferase family)
MMPGGGDVRFGLEIVPFGELAEPRLVADLAVEAEAAGWDGVSVWDHVGVPFGAGDPWVMLAAIAARTARLRLCVGVAAVPRYRPHLLARTLAGLDRLSGGRMIFGAGLGGVPEEFSTYGEEGDPAARAEMLDEALEVVTRLLAGEPVTFEGRRYVVHGAMLAPASLQRPRIPVWIGGESRRAMRRAARWDGWIVPTVDESGAITKRPEEIERSAAFLRKARAGADPIEIAVSGISETRESPLVRVYEEAGATWWLESLFGLRGSVDDLRRVIRRGPPAG